jgi:FkbM family methyltransferase
MVSGTRAACSNRSGKAFLLEYELSAKNEIVDKPTKMLVDVDTLDHIIQNLQINRVNMAKIDVNGHEYQVIEGSRNTLKNCKPTLLMEVMLENKQRVSNYLKKFGYKTKIINKEKRYINILFK